MLPQNFTNKSQEMIQNSARVAQQNGQPQVEPPHMFFALIEDQDGMVYSVLQKFNANLISIKASAQSLIDRMPKQKMEALAGGPISQIMLGQAMLYIFQTASAEAKKIGDEYISVEHLLLAFLANKNPISDLLATQDVNYDGALKILATIR